MKNLAERLNKALNDKGLKQNQFAEMVGVAPSSVNLWLSAKTMPKTEHLPLIGRVLGVSIDYLLGRKNEDSNTPIPVQNNHENEEKTLHYEKKKGGDYWREKYYKLLEENNQLLRNQIDNTKD